MTNSDTRHAALKARAFAAADGIMAEFGAPDDLDARDVLRSLLALAWVQGSSVGGMENMALVERHFADLLREDDPRG